MLTTIKRTALAVIAVIALLATTSGQALAAGPEPGDGADRLRETPLNPWETTIVLVHVTNGADQPADTSGVMPDFEAYVNGIRPYIVNHTVGQDEFCGGSGDAVTGQGAGGCNDVGDPLTIGQSTAIALRRAGSACDRRSFTQCHIVLVNYAAPTTLEGQLEAVAVAWQLERRRHVVHTIGIDSGQTDDYRRLIQFNGVVAGTGLSYSIGSADGFQSSFEWLLAEITTYVWDWPEEPYSDKSWPEPPPEPRPGYPEPPCDGDFIDPATGECGSDIVWPDSFPENQV